MASEVDRAIERGKALIITPKNWAEFQHYKDRSPPWIKLHKGLLDDWEYQCLPVASRALAPMLWLLASESANGEIDANSKKLAFRLRMTEREVTDALKPLIDGGFFVRKDDASAVIAESKPDAMPETEERQSRERDREAAPMALPGWLNEETWKAYCKHRGSKFTEHAKTLTIKQLTKFKAAGHDPNSIIETSIANGWKGVFEPKSKGFVQPAPVAKIPFAPPPEQIERANPDFVRKLLSGVGKAMP